MFAWQQKARGVGILTRMSDLTPAGGPKLGPISYKPFKSMNVTHIDSPQGWQTNCSVNGRWSRQRRWAHGSIRKQELDPRKEQMVDIILLLMVIASAISLLVVSPRDLQKKAILALREYEDMELSRAHGRGEDGQAKAVLLNLSRSGSHPSTDRPRAING